MLNKTGHRGERYVFHHVLLFLYADLKLICICVGLQSNEEMNVLLALDDRKCLNILHRHSVDSHKLEKLVDQSVNQADTILKEYAKYAKDGHANRMPAQLAKAFLNGVFSGTVAHLNENEQRTLQIPPLTNLLNNDETPVYFKNDDYLGEGNGIESDRKSVV